MEAGHMRRTALRLDIHTHIKRQEVGREWDICENFRNKLYSGSIDCVTIICIVYDIFLLNPNANKLQTVFCTEYPEYDAATAVATTNMEKQK